MSQMTLANGVERILKERVPGVTSRGAGGHVICSERPDGHTPTTLRGSTHFISPLFCTRRWPKPTWCKGGRIGTRQSLSLALPIKRLFAEMRGWRTEGCWSRRGCDDEMQGRMSAQRARGSRARQTATYAACHPPHPCGVRATSGQAAQPEPRFRRGGQARSAASASVAGYRSGDHARATSSAAATASFFRFRHRFREKWSQNRLLGSKREFGRGEINVPKSRANLVDVRPSLGFSRTQNSIL